MSDQQYLYRCDKCDTIITTEKMGYVECPECKTGEHIMDYDDYGDYDNLVLGGGKFNWNRW